MEATKLSTDRGRGKEDVAHICNGILLSHEKECNNATYSNMDQPEDYHTKSDRERQISMISLICRL